MNFSKSAYLSRRVMRGGRHPERLYFRVWLIALRVVCVLVLLAGVSVVGLGLGAFMGIVKGAPEMSIHSLTVNKLNSYVYDRDGNEIVQIRTETNRIYVEAKDMSPYMLNAIVAVEDSRFYQHNGIDIKGILRAGLAQLRGGSEGGSTITQQLIKNMVLSSEVSMTRKIREWYLALNLEYDLTQQYGHDRAKELILETYLNYVNFGNSAYGVEAASQRYFDKHASDLTISEAAVLAAVVNAPGRYDPIVNRDGRSRDRQLLVLERMLDQNYITEAEYEAAVQDDVFGRIAALNEQYKEKNDVIYSYFVDAAISQVRDDLVDELGYTEADASNMVNYGGIKIYLTQDDAIQAIVDKAYSDPSNFQTETWYQATYYLTIFDEKDPDDSSLATNLSFVGLYGSEERIYEAIASFKAKYVSADMVEGVDYVERTEINVEPQSTSVIIDQHTGYVVAMAAGRGQKTTNFSLNRATDSPRQPGSTFKVIASFSAALDAGGLTPASVFDDAPFTYKDWTPHNWWGDYYKGLCTLREACANSQNIIASKCMIDVGVETNFEYALKYGFTTLRSEPDENGNTDVVPSLCLGSGSVTNLELTAAYAAIANKGVYIEPQFYSRVEDSEGNILLEKKPETHPVIKESTAWLLTNMMRDVVTGANGGTGAYANFDSGMGIAGKTGTTSEMNDLWFVGFTPYYTMGVWNGYDYNAYRNVDSSVFTLADNYHTRLFATIMKEIHTYLPDKPFDDPPADITTVAVCKESGKLATDLCQSDPRGSCAYMEYVDINNAPTEYCDVHVLSTVCLDSHMAPGPYCPEDRISSGVFIKRTEEQLAAINGDPGLIQDWIYELPSEYIPTQVCNYHTEEWWEEEQRRQEEEQLYPPDDSSYPEGIPGYGDNSSALPGGLFE